LGSDVPKALDQIIVKEKHGTALSVPKGHAGREKIAQDPCRHPPGGVSIAGQGDRFRGCDAGSSESNIKQFLFSHDFSSFLK
jgi:hypothetical protein